MEYQGVCNTKQNDNTVNGRKQGKNNYKINQTVNFW